MEINISSFFFITSTAHATLNDPFNYLLGKASPSQLIFLPGGIHFASPRANNAQYLTLLNIHGIAGGTFKNSFNQQVYFAGILRDIYSSQRFSIHYLLGAMYGYKNNLKGFGKFIGHDPGPILALGGEWHCTRHFSLNICTYGAGILGGLSYKFN